MKPNEMRSFKDCIDEIKQLAILTKGKDSVDLADLANYMEMVYRMIAERNGD